MVSGMLAFDGSPAAAACRAGVGGPARLKLSGLRERAPWLPHRSVHVINGTGVAPANCQNVAPTFLQTGNPDLEPEKSKSVTLGLVWDVVRIPPERQATKYADAA